MRWQELILEEKEVAVLSKNEIVFEIDSVSESLVKNSKQLRRLFGDFIIIDDI